MKLTTKLHLALAIAAGIFTTSAIAGPGGHSPSDFPTKVATKTEAITCCTEKASVAMACTSCKTLDVKNGEKDKKGILAWFAPDSNHEVPAGQGNTVSIGEYTHTCSKCGDKSAYVCTDHKKA